MRKLFTLLLTLVSAFTFAQNVVERTVTFDFTEPDKLNPSFGMTGADMSYVDGTTFTNGPISLYFTSGNLKSLLKRDASRKFYVQVFRGTKMTVKSTDAELREFRLGEYDVSAGLAMTETGKGSFRLGKWSCGGKTGIKSVTVENMQQSDAEITKVIVTYTSPLDVLTATNITPANNSTVKNFTEMVVTLDADIESAAERIALRDNGGIYMYLNLKSISGKKVTYVPEEALTVAGTYSVQFPEKTFVAKDGSFNKQFTTKFTYELPYDTFNPTTIPGGEVASLPTSMDVVFPSTIGNRVTNVTGTIVGRTFDIKETKSNEVVGIVEASVKSDNKTVKLTVKNMTDADRAKRGIYTITIPEKAVYDINFGTANARFNEAFTITYKVAGADAPSSEVLAEASALLKKTGIGYPTANASERTTLAEMVANEEGSDAAFRTAMDAFCNSTNINYPVAGKYYKIANVQADGTKYYLAYNNGKVSLTTSASSAHSFTAVDASVATTSKVVRAFVTADGKYLHALVSSDDYNAATANNVTDANSKAGKLTLEKLVNQEAPAATLGYITMSGNIGKEFGQGSDVIAYSTVRANGGIYQGRQTPVFNASLSSAFVFVEANTPDPITSYDVTPSKDAVVQAVGEIEVTVNNAENVVVNSSKNITLASQYGTVNVTSIEVTGKSKNVLKLKVNATDNGKYTLNIPEGALSFYFIDHDIQLPSFTSTFEVKTNDVFNYDFDQNYKLYTNILDDKKYNPEDLNNFALYTDETEMFINDANNTVWLINDDLQTVALGVAEKKSTYTSKQIEVLYRNNAKLGVIDYYISTTMVMLTSGQKAIINSSTDKVVTEEERHYTYYLYAKFDKKLSADNVPNGRYGFIYNRGCFGDSNFGAYLASPSTVSKSSCHLNARGQYWFNIDKTATGINDVNADKLQNNVIYDLMGRRLTERPKTGMYIMNGKKYIAK